MDIARGGIFNFVQTMIHIHAAEKWNVDAKEIHPTSTITIEGNVQNEKNEKKRTTSERSVDRFIGRHVRSYSLADRSFLLDDDWNERLLLLLASCPETILHRWSSSLRQYSSRSTCSLPIRVYIRHFLLSSKKFCLAHYSKQCRIWSGNAVGSMKADQRSLFNQKRIMRTRRVVRIHQSTSKGTISSVDSSMTLHYCHKLFREGKPIRILLSFAFDRGVLITKQKNVAFLYLTAFSLVNFSSPLVLPTTVLPTSRFFALVDRPCNYHKSPRVLIKLMSSVWAFMNCKVWRTSNPEWHRSVSSMERYRSNLYRTWISFFSLETIESIEWIVRSCVMLKTRKQSSATTNPHLPRRASNSKSSIHSCSSKWSNVSACLTSN